MERLYIGSFLFIVLFLGCTKSQAQDDIFKILAKPLESMNLNLLWPTEGLAKHEAYKKNEFLKYDSKVIFRSGELEVMLIFHPIGEHLSTTYHPHIEFQRLLTNLSPNNEDQEIPVYSWGDKDLKERNADWGVEAYLTPRVEVSKFSHLKLVSFYKEDKGMVVMLYCFNDPEELPLLLRFLDDDKDER